ncbi:NADH-quinone oxidoreductase subunit N [Tundrisphaera sp. TA3]|uniref:NADH-quinone oxidoreductase subunit N n=1 Tax=Tundrisphaera sp. TA3 TaxID=3435775 RepID=UPI003EB90BA5
MPVTVISPDPRDLLHLAPEVILATWGLVVLGIDFGLLRRTSADRKGRVLGLITLIGVLAALVSTILPEIPGLAPTTHREPSLMLGTVVGGTLVGRINAVVLILLGLVVALSTTWRFTEHWGEYFALTLWAAVGMLFLIASEELVTLFLSLEMMTICLYLLAAFEKGQGRSPEAGLKYFVYGSVSSGLFLFGLSLVYGLTGTTRLAGIGQALMADGARAGLDGDVARAMAVLLVLVGFGFKVAAVPFHQWAPDVYEGAPAPVTAWIATGSKLASVIALLKVMVQSLGPWAYRATMEPGAANGPASAGWVGLVALIAAATMTFGNVAALVQTNFKRLLAYSSIAHTGYLLVGVLAAVVSVNNASASRAVLYYLVVYSFTTLGAFAVAAWLFRDKGSERIDDLDGLASHSPGLAVCILILMVSLIGIPPLGGFFGKLFLFMEALNTAPDSAHRLTFLWLVLVGFLNSVVSAFYYVRVIRAMFLRPPSGVPMRRASPAIATSIVLAAVVAVLFGIYARTVTDASVIPHSRMFRVGGAALVSEIFEEDDDDIDPVLLPAPLPVQRIGPDAQAK